MISTISPLPISVVAASMSSSEVSASRLKARPSRRRSIAFGPQAWQAVACAWKRRSLGSAYSRAQSAHSGNGAIVVCARSYGARWNTDSRGPQSVQAVNG